MSYMTRAMKSRDPRFARVLSKLGYSQPDAQAEPEAPAPEPVDEIADVRAEYEAVVGRRPFMGWDIETLREKIAAAKDAN